MYNSMLLENTTFSEYIMIKHLNGYSFNEKS